MGSWHVGILVDLAPVLTHRFLPLLKQWIILERARKRGPRVAPRDFKGYDLRPSRNPVADEVPQPVQRFLTGVPFGRQSKRLAAGSPVAVPRHRFDEHGYLHDALLPHAANVP